MKDALHGLRGSDGEVFLRSTLPRRRGQRLDVVLVAVMELVSGGILARSALRTSHIVLVAGMWRISGGILSRGR